MKKWGVCIAAALLLQIAAAFGQETPRSPAASGPPDLHQARLIKVTRMAAAWRNEPMELLLRGGGSAAGRFAAIDAGAFRLRTRDGWRDVPVSAVESVVLKRKPQDLLFVGLTGAGLAGLFAGGASLGSASSNQTVITAAAVGAVIGFTVGWKAFYQNTVIRLE